MGQVAAKPRKGCLVQIYIPLTVSDLTALEPPKEGVVEVSVLEGEEGYEEASAAARDDAGLASLERARDEDQVPVRLVAAAFVQDPAAPPATWRRIDSLYVDDAAGRRLSEKAVVAETQEEADEAVGRLLDEPLMWADVSERARLHDFLCGEGDW